MWKWIDICMEEIKPFTSQQTPNVWNPNVIAKIIKPLGKDRDDNAHNLVGSKDFWNWTWKVSRISEKALLHWT